MRRLLRHKKIKPYLSLIFTGIFAFHFLLLHGGLSGFVICIGNDGHVAVERSIDDVACSDTKISSLLEITAEHTENCCVLDANHCGDCRDISLTFDCQDEQVRLPQDQVDTQPARSYITPQSLHDIGAIEACHQYPAKSTHTSYHLSLASIRSTVLLI